MMRLLALAFAYSSKFKARKTGDPHCVVAISSSNFCLVDWLLLLLFATDLTLFAPGAQSHERRCHDRFMNRVNAVLSNEFSQIVNHVFWDDSLRQSSSLQLWATRLASDFAPTSEWDAQEARPTNCLC
jgi:hypothetical protein